jgi:hypothetical protein
MTDQDDDRPPQPTDAGEAPYFHARADWHERRASVATDASTVTLHRRFARLYRARAANPLVYEYP